MPASAKGSYGTTNFYTYGLTDHVELAAIIYGVDNVNPPQFSTLGLGYKSVHEIFRDAAPEREVKWTTGFMLRISLNDTNSNPSVGY